MAKKSQLSINRDPEYLCPFFLAKLNRAVHAAQMDGYPIQVFEGYRSPQRQDELFSQGRSRPGAIVTRAKSWQSLHQYGLAADIAFMIDGKWSWEGAFDKLVPIFQRCGLEWYGTGDAGHYQLLKGMTVSECEQITRKDGLLELWRIFQKGM